MSARAVAKVVGIFHNISYYAPEMRTFAEVGLPEYWRAYMCYRSAPMGAVTAPVATATFYNFAPRVVEAGLPSAWELISPSDAIARRDDAIDLALRRALGDLIGLDAVGDAAALALAAIADVSGVGRALYAAHAELPVPDEPHMALWHASTLWREYRGDGHNIALAAAGVDGIECHVLLAGRGVASKETICKIRGWTAEEWDAAADRLRARDLLDAEGTVTDAGRSYRSDIERRTDMLMATPIARLGDDGAARLVDLMSPLVEHLVGTGAVAGTWPPPQPPS